MKDIFKTEKSFVLFSGDIHFSQIIEHSSKWKGTSRFSPFNTVEISSSAAHSILFTAKPGGMVISSQDGGNVK